MWRSQTFENTYLGGYLLVIPYEAFPFWVGDGPPYDDLCNFSPGPIDYLPIGDQFGIFVAGPDGDIIHEAWWRDDPGGSLILAAWNEWGTEDRDEWLTAQLGRRDLEWTRHPEVLVVETGVLMLLHAEGAAMEAKLAAPGRTAVGGECVPVGVAPGAYAVETIEIEERPEGNHCVEVCRFVRVPVESKN